MRIKKPLLMIPYLIFLFLLLETASFITLRFGQIKGVVYKEYPVTPEEYQTYLQRRHPLVGWPDPVYERDHLLDSTGAHISPSFPDPRATPPFITVYGDSYAFGYVVDHSKGWGDVLSRKLNRRVSVFAKGGYGTDQALLRFMANVEDNSDPVSGGAFDKAPISILGVCTENILRNVNQYRQYLYQGPDPLNFKPRFILTPNGELALVPIASLTYEEYLHMRSVPEKYLCCECFLPRGKFGLARMSFPYTFALLKTMATQYHILAELKGKVWYEDFYDRNHPCQSLQVTIGIIDEFIRLAKEKDKAPLVIILPTMNDFQHYRSRGVWVYAPLIAALKEKGIPYMDFGPYLYKKMNGAPIKSFFQVNHYTIESDAFLAEAVYEYLKEHYAHLLSQ